MASVTVTAPPAPPPAPQTVKECSISFARDRKRPNRVDNEAKACLDDLALALNRQADAKLVVTGKPHRRRKPIATPPSAPSTSANT